MVDIRLAPLDRALLLAAALLSAAPAAADPPAAYAARRGAELTFRDWRLACLGDACAIRAAVRGADGSAVLALEARPDGQGGQLALSTPLPLFLPDGISIALGDAAPRDVPWRTCDRASCQALAPFDADLLAALKRERVADVTLTLLDGVRVRLPASLLGFTAAWDAAARQPPAPAPRAAEATPPPAPGAEPTAPPEEEPSAAPKTSKAGPQAVTPP
ncbi:invasion associated locus B family protein [Amaricoccus sp.]|uniref:invasion associated locus B family protein n=1 Tax=Amaricoccus sp. TaxID=1872485 RepID=UPI001B79F754|nr:invasion associated locus B family protein [Amaricoccus sp.]MBP7001945.1 invasion associated locus B family protein [Amaricoccus sp.]